MAHNQGGYVKIWRKLLKSPIMGHDGLFRLWVHCLLLAAWKDAKQLIPGTLKEAVVERGSFFTSKKHIHDVMYPRFDEDGNVIKRDHVPAQSTVWHWLECLERMGCLTINNVVYRCTKVTICNYGSYQSKDDARCKPVVSRLEAGCKLPRKDPYIDEEDEEEEELPPVGEESKKRQRNLLWDAVCEVFELNPVTKSDRSRIGKVVADLKAKNATPDEIHVRFGRYVASWPSITPTPEALVKHWDTFATERIRTPTRGNSVDLMGTLTEFMSGGSNGQG